MCYLAREKQAAAAPAGAATLPPGPQRLGPRMIGAIAAAIIGGMAVAAMVSPSTSRLPTEDVSGAAVAPFAANTGTLPATSAGERSLPVDDEVPGASGVVKAGLGHCDHSL